MASSSKKRKEELILNLSAKYRRINSSKDFLSEPMLNYILKNASQKAYFKLIQISKYFLVNEPPQIRKFERIYYDGDWDLDPDRVSDLDGNRLWINTESFDWRCSSVSLNGLLQRCFDVTLSWLRLEDQQLTYDELKLLMEKHIVTSLELYQCQITHSNGEEVSIEDILKMAPLLSELSYYPSQPFIFNSQKVAGLPKFYHLDSIELLDLAENLCCCAFRSFLKKAPRVTSGRFKFADDLSPRYLRKFQIAVFKEVNPDIEVNCSNQTIYFGEFDEEW